MKYVKLISVILVLILWLFTSLITIIQKEYPSVTVKYKSDILAIIILIIISLVIVAI